MLVAPQDRFVAASGGERLDPSETRQSPCHDLSGNRPGNLVVGEM
jgi:hypothetical protein